MNDRPTAPLPQGLARFLARVPEPLLRGPVTLGARAAGFSAFLLRAPMIEAALAHPDVEVPYRERSAELGVGAFPLALDGPDHLRARDLIAGALTASEAAHVAGRGAAGARAAEAVARPSRYADVDLLDEVVLPSLDAWTETWFGLEGHGPLLRIVGVATAHAMFFNPARPRAAVDQRALDFVIRTLADARLVLGPAMADAPTGTVAASLRDHGDLDATTALTHLIGLCVGPLALTPIALASVIDELLGRPGSVGLAGVYDRRTAAERYHEILDDRPPLPGVPRRCPIPVDVRVQNRTRRLPAGTFLAVNQVAELEDPDPGSPAYGRGPHLCMGSRQSSEVASAVLAEIAPVHPLRNTGAAGKLHRATPPIRLRNWPAPSGLRVLATRR